MTAVERYGQGLDQVQVAPDLAIDVLREQLAPGATDEELRHFGRVCTVLDLSPFAGQITLIGRHDRRVGRQVFRPQITVDGRRARAERTGLLDGIEGPVWCGPRNEAGELVWGDVWTEDDEFPYCARALVYRKDWSRPSNGTAKWSEMAQYVSDGRGGQKLSPFWYRMPSHMLGKVAEALALRRAFPNDASYRLAATYVGDDTASSVAEAQPAPTPDVRPADQDRVPEHVYNDAPEAQAWGPGEEPF